MKRIADVPSDSRRLDAFASAADERLADATGSRSRATSGRAAVIRIGVRYINRMVDPGPHANPKIYFRNIDPDDKLIKGTMSNFMKRVEYAIDGPAKIVLTHATLVPADAKSTEFLLDIDAVSDSKPLNEEAEILAKVNELHDRAGDVFEALITDDARKLFDGP